MPGDNAEPEIDWSLTTWEGARKEQIRRWKELPLEDLVAALEEMQTLAEQFGSRRAGLKEKEPDRLIGQQEQSS
jgi:hypothetical protein